MILKSRWEVCPDSGSSCHSLANVIDAVRKKPIIAAVRARSNSTMSLFNYCCGVNQGSAISITTMPANHAGEIIDFSNTLYLGGPYWVIKNTRGNEWREIGYFRIA